MKIIRHIDCEYCCKFCGNFETINEFIMLMEQLNGGEVYQRILKVRRFSEKDSALIINDVIKGLMYIHGIQILHRDLKLENILFSNRENNLGVKIVDFGIATFTDRTDIFKHCGTPGYVAPEMLHDKD